MLYDWKKPQNCRCVYRSGSLAARRHNGKAEPLSPWNLFLHIVPSTRLYLIVLPKWPLCTVSCILFSFWFVLFGFKIELLFIQ